MISNMNIPRIRKRIFGKLSKHFHLTDKITIITAAGAPYYELLRDNLVSSVLECEPYSDIIIWNLGLNNEQRNELKRITSHHTGKVKICTYPEENLSPHYAMSKFNYAFKCYCLYQSLAIIATRYALWIDASAIVTGVLGAERNLMNLYGFYCSRSCHDVALLTHKTVVDNFMGDKLGYVSKPMLYAGLIGWDMTNHKALALLNEWYQLSRVEENISPEGASKQNHRYDQSLLSMVYYSRYKEIPYLCLYRYNINIQQDRNIR